MAKSNRLKSHSRKGAAAAASNGAWMALPIHKASMGCLARLGVRGRREGGRALPTWCSPLTLPLSHPLTQQKSIAWTKRPSGTSSQPRSSEGSAAPAAEAAGGGDDSPYKRHRQMCSYTACTTHYRGGTPRRRGATRKMSSTAQPRQGRWLTATSMRTTALLSTA
jgi:hypothetical protein